ncbi:MAG: hypothetical protein NKF70_01240 [Methanobacterium sp. ERen5]|nr:MAG: hypothetical protein NKF70_01240 [Methanobacterium sp. ERen5]
MKKMISMIFGMGIIGFIILLIVLLSFHSPASAEALVKEADIGGEGIQIQFITVPSDDNLKVSITNVTKISDTTNDAEIKVYALKIEGVNGQLPESYGNNVIETSKFENLKTNWFEGNITYDKGAKSLGFVTNNVKAHVTILKRL